MTRALLLWFVLLTGGLQATGQETFIVQFDSVQTGYGTGRSVFENDSGYVLFNVVLSEDGLFKARPGCYQLDHNGHLLSRRQYEQGRLHHSIFGFFSPVGRIDNTGFLSAVDRFNYDPFIQETILYRFSLLGDSIYSNVIITSPPEDSIRIGIRQTRFTSDGGAILGGYRDPLNTLGQGFLVKLDSSSTILWSHTYGAVDHINEIYGVAEYKNHGFLAVGERLMSYVNNNSFLIRTDSLGNQLWRREFGGNADVTGMVRVTADGNCVTWSEYREVGWPLLYQQLMLTKWDADGDIIWQKRSHYQSNAACGDLEVLPDGSFITVGTQGAFGALMKFSPTGDSLWTRYLEVFAFATGAAHNVYDVEPTSDGGFIMTGDAFQGWADPTPNLQTIWVIKTDSLGCVVPGCQNVGVQEMVLDLQDLLHISPNPTSEYVSLALDLPEGGQVQGQVQAHLLDAQGKPVLQQQVQQNLNQLRATLEVRALPAGTYYLHLRDAKRWLAGGKVVVQ